MPIYEYSCKSCGHDFEKLQKISAPTPDCPECGQEVAKKVSKTSFQLKGSGWYVTDYKSAPEDKAAPAPAATEATPAASESSSSESTSAPKETPASTPKETSTSTPKETSTPAKPASAPSSSSGDASAA